MITERGACAGRTPPDDQPPLPVELVTASPAPAVPVNIVFAGGCSHAAALPAGPAIDPPDAAARLSAGYARLSQDIAAAAPDLMIVITDRHQQSFSTGTFVVGTGERHTGSMAVRDRPDLDLSLKGMPAYAYAIADCLRAEGVEVTEVGRVDLDHGLIVPLRELLPRPGIPVVPIVTQPARGFSPFGARSFGEVLRYVVEAREERIAVLATGGLSHRLDPGEVGNSDVEFDSHVLQMLHDGRGPELGDLDPYTLLRHGHHEFLNWLVMLGMIGPGVRGEVYAYEPMPQSGGARAVVNMLLSERKTPAA
ncbi:DODA-type extradiol aromatic ring-opening family dioxygenase [Pseudonocardia sp. T1-2H]|uniref:DODA-type extradiol aromatic ring-opening family dioxygenase n=1 Tax=Pseudonocardia sp. T1-2H TaxID=3128899 RepID=UPI00310161D8